MKKNPTNKKSTPEELINEGLGNKEKFKSKTYRKLKGKLRDENIETIKEDTEDEDINEKDV